jgi:hypothetical protein
MLLLMKYLKNSYFFRWMRELDNINRGGCRTNKHARTDFFLKLWHKNIYCRSIKKWKSCYRLSWHAIIVYFSNHKERCKFASSNKLITLIQLCNFYLFHCLKINKIKFLVLFILFYVSIVGSFVGLIPILFCCNATFNHWSKYW